MSFFSHYAVVWLWPFIFALHWLSLISVSAAPPGERLLLFVGSNTLGERAVPALAAAYLETQKKATYVRTESQGETIFVEATLPDGKAVYVEIHATGSGDCFTSLINKYPGAKTACDIGMSSRRFNTEEGDEIEKELVYSPGERGKVPGEGCEHPVALDGLAVVVHESNPLSRIGFNDLKAIYSRTLTEWSQARGWQGGSLTIVPLRRKAPSGTLDFFVNRIKPDSGPMQDEKQIAAFTSSNDLVKAVAASPGAIGFVGASYAISPGLKRLQVFDDSPNMEMLPTEAVFPDSATIQNGSYPLSRLVYFYTPYRPDNKEVQPFIRFALSEQGQTVLAELGGLVRIEGTAHHVPENEDDNLRTTVSMASTSRTRKIILRLHGSNTVGAEAGVALAMNYLIELRDRSGLKRPSPIEDMTTGIETLEGEKALAHDLMCDVDGDGTWETIEIRSTGSSDAFRDLKNGACDVGMSSRPITEAERINLMDACGDLAQPEAQFALGLDAVAIVVNSKNPVDSLTVEQLRGIFTGDITNWKDVGGGDATIHVHARPDRSGTFKRFSDTVLFGRALVAGAKRHAENAALASAVEADTDGIGFAPMAQTRNTKVLRIGHKGSARMVPPTASTVRSGYYPATLCRYVYLYVPAEKASGVEAIANLPNAREFATQSQTWRGQVIIEESGFIADINTGDAARLATRKKDEKMEPYLLRLAELEHSVHSGKIKLQLDPNDLSVCPRLLFKPNGKVLTVESENIVSLKFPSWMRMFPEATNQLIIEGWTDSAENDDAAQKESLMRANILARMIGETQRIQLASAGRGISKGVPNTDEESKQINRRVVIRRVETVR